jgi:Zn ribbon nucleic-acid-binding protein
LRISAIPHCDGVECGFGRGEVPKSAHRKEQPLESGMVALDAVVEMLSRDVPDGSADE